jgi:stage II sporulation protein E
MNATLVIRKSDSNKFKIIEVVSDICKHKMAVVSVEPSKTRGWDVVTMKTAPKFDVVFGTATCPKATSKISGDCYSIIRISEDKFLLALCDGMGSGEKAERTSSLAIGLIENFYKAGFDNDIILSSINKLLSISRDEIFSALDICVIDTRSGVADFIKMGAPQSYMKHKNEIEEICGGALPLGIIQEVTPFIIKKVIRNGDFVYLFTDGISDSFRNENELADFVNNQAELNPQALAEGLINRAIELNGKAIDDMTVIVAKIFEIPNF